MSVRRPVKIIRGRETRDGAGVKLMRVFSQEDVTSFDPFLLLDAFGSDDPKDYIAGFPMHPHRGIETVTYLLEGSVSHKDSTGTAGIIGPGDLQWMSAGSGILHEEMPQPSPHGVHGLQLWINLPSREKMCTPEYRGVLSQEIPIVPTGSGTVRVIAGSWGSAQGPVIGVSRSPVYLDVSLDGGADLTIDIPSKRTAFIYILKGALSMAEPMAYLAGTCALLGDGDEVAVKAGPEGARFILVHATPIAESIAWGGPIVMNTRAELETAFRELEEGTFIREV